MLEEQENNPLHGVKLETLLTELVEHYGFEILAEQININCFKSFPSISSSLKFLRKTAWARDKVEAFYLYKYKRLPRPSDQEHQLPPRDRTIPLEQKPKLPAAIEPGEREFFDDPLSGPKPYKNTKPRQRSDAASGSAAKKPVRKPAVGGEPGSDRAKEDSADNNATPDPWGKWRAKNKGVDDE